MVPDAEIGKCHLESVMSSDMISHESERRAELRQAHRLGECILCIAALPMDRSQRVAASEFGSADRIESRAEFPWVSASGTCHDVKCIGPRRLWSLRIITPVLIFKQWQCLREPVEATLHGCVLHIETCFTGMLQKIKDVNVEPYGCEPVICLPESKLAACTLPIHQRLNGALDAIPDTLVFLH